MICGHFIDLPALVTGLILVVRQLYKADITHLTISFASWSTDVTDGTQFLEPVFDAMHAAFQRNLALRCALTAWLVVAGSTKESRSCRLCIQTAVLDGPSSSWLLRSLITHFLSVLHCRLMTQLANQPGFGWNSCNILLLLRSLMVSWASSRHRKEYEKVHFFCSKVTLRVPEAVCSETDLCKEFPYGCQRIAQLAPGRARLAFLMALHPRYRLQLTLA